MDSEGVLLPVIHEHVMMPWNDMKKGDCCGRFLKLQVMATIAKAAMFLSTRNVVTMPLYLSNTHLTLFTLFGLLCNFNLDLHCAKYLPPEVIENSKMHHHKLTLIKYRTEFDCDAKCGNHCYGFPYKCHECDLAFHLDCVWRPSELKYPLELNYSYHSLHPLKLFMGQLPDYSDGKCRLCGRKIDVRLFYHCSSCNFNLDMHCVLNPPPQYLMDMKSHDHQLTLLPRLDSFTCNACGVKGDRSPYVCFQCGFMIHQDCLDLPRLININRHDHRVSQTSVLGVVNSVCGVCRQKVDWTCGGYSCQRCPGYVVHSKCATRYDVWNGKELEGVPEEIEDIEPYVVIDDNTIQHFSHKEHYLKLYVNGVLCNDNKRCSACTHSICYQSFYGCIDCDYYLHQNCAEYPTRKWHVLHNERLTLVTNEADLFECNACDRKSNGFRYQCGKKTFDVRCGSISEPFVHPSHPHHPLYYTSPNQRRKCNGCNCIICSWSSPVLSCIEDDCGYVLCFNCATLPQVVKHRVDDHPLLLCYGEKASGKYWCDICEKETKPNTWFYTCKDHRCSLHRECVLGDFSGLMPKSTIKYMDISYEVVVNNGISRPSCKRCKSHCMYPNILKMLGASDPYFCSMICIHIWTYHL